MWDETYLSSLDLRMRTVAWTLKGYSRMKMCFLARKRLPWPGVRASFGEGDGNPLQYSCLENPMNRGAWQATVHSVVKSQTQPGQFSPKELLRYETNRWFWRIRKESLSEEDNNDSDKVWQHEGQSWPGGQHREEWEIREKSGLFHSSLGSWCSGSVSP